MALDFIEEAPFLFPSYPLFDWDQFPQSRDSLESGKPVALFEAVCWDSMVDKLAQIVYTLESSWEAPPFFPEGEEKIFTASMYNQMLFAMRIIFPFPYGSNYYMDKYMASTGDPLTPEHLLFAANWVNWIVEIARGSVGLEKLSIPYNSVTTCNPNADVLVSAPMETWIQAQSNKKVTLENLPYVSAATKRCSFSKESANVLMKKAANVFVEEESKTKKYVSALRRISVPGAVEAIGETISNAGVLMGSGIHFIVGGISQTPCVAEIILPGAVAGALQYCGRSSQKVELPILFGQMTQPEMISYTNHTAEVAFAEPEQASCVPLIGRSKEMAEISDANSVRTERIDHFSKSSQGAELFVKRAVQAASRYLGESSTEISAETPGSVQTDIQLSTFTQKSPNVITMTARPGWTDAVSRGTASALLSKLDAANVTVRDSSTTQGICNLERMRSANVGSKTQTFSKKSCSVGIFYIPLQPDSRTLYIRQTYKEAIKINDMLYIDQWPDQGLKDDGTLFLWKLYDTVMHVGNTLYIGSMPRTGKTDGVTLLI